MKGRPYMIGLAGRAGAGKDTVSGALRACWFGETGLGPSPFAQPGALVVTAFAAPIKRGLDAMLGVNVDTLTREEKEARIEWLGASPRELLQTLGTEWGRGMVAEDLWPRVLERRLAGTVRAGDFVVVSDVRFPNELAWIRRQGGRVWWVERDGLAPVRSHSSEGAIGAADCDRTILNLGTLEDLVREVERAWRAFFVEEGRGLVEAGAGQ